MKKGKFLGIVSLKPNTGSTTVALNLAVALQNKGQRVVVVDANNTSSLEHLYASQMPVSLLDDEIILSHGIRIIPNADILTMSLPDLAVSNDFIIIDAPKDTPTLRRYLNVVDEAFIVHSPEYSSKHVLDASDLLERNKVTRLGVILNKSHEGSIDVLYGHPVVCKIPHSDLVVKSFQAKHPLLTLEPQARISKKFLKMADMLT